MITSLLKWFVLSVVLPTIGKSATNATLSTATVVARVRVGRNAVQSMCVQIVGNQMTGPKPPKHHRRGVEARGAIESKNTSTKLYLHITIPFSSMRVSPTMINKTLPIIEIYSPDRDSS
jgi:hypothetical protein